MLQCYTRIVHKDKEIIGELADYFFITGPQKAVQQVNAEYTEVQADCGPELEKWWAIQGSNL